MLGAGGGKSPNLNHEPKLGFPRFEFRPMVRLPPSTAITRYDHRPTFQVEVSNSCTVTVTLVQNRTRSLQIGIIGDISGSIQRFFPGKVETPSSEYQGSPPQSTKSAG